MAAPLDLPVGNEKHFQQWKRKKKKRKKKGGTKNERKREKARERQEKGERIALLLSCFLFFYL